MTKDGKVKSGVENFEPALLDLRKKLFDLEKNSIPLIIESSPNQEIHANNSIGVLFEDVRKPPAIDEATNLAVMDDTSKPNDIGSSKKKGRKATVRGTRIEFDSTWFPFEWLAFRQFGPLSETPYEAWSVLVSSTRDKPIEVQDDPINESDSGDDVVKRRDTSLGRSTQRKKRRKEKRNQTVIKSVGTIEVDEEDDYPVSAVLSEISSFRTDLVQSEAAQREASSAKIAELKMNLIDRMTVSVEEKQKMYKSLYDSLP